MADNEAAAAPLIVKESVLENALRPTPELKTCGDVVPPQINPAFSPQKFFLKSITTRSQASIPNLLMEEVVVAGKSGLNEIPPLFNTDIGTLTITFLA